MQLFEEVLRDITVAIMNFDVYIAFWLLNGTDTVLFSDDTYSAVLQKQNNFSLSQYKALWYTVHLFGLTAPCVFDRGQVWISLHPLL